MNMRSCRVCSDTITISYLGYQSVELMFVRFAKSILTWRELVPSRVSVINTPRVERVGACVRS